MVQDPGTIFNYNSVCSQLLINVIHNQTGGDALGFAQKNLFNPLGTNDYEWGTDVLNFTNKTKVINGTGGLKMRVRDAAKFGYLYLKGGIWDGQQIIAKHWIEESTKRHMDIPGSVGLVIDNYGYQWWIHSFGFHALGHKGQYIFVIPELDVVVVFISSLRGYQTFYPIRLVKKFVIPAVKSNQPLPDNPEALALLKKMISQHKLLRYISPQ